MKHNLINIRNNNRLHLILNLYRFTTEEPEGHSNFAVNDIAEHNSKTK